MEKIKKLRIKGRERSRTTLINNLRRYHGYYGYLIFNG